MLELNTGSGRAIRRQTFSLVASFSQNVLEEVDSPLVPPVQELPRSSVRFRKFEEMVEMFPCSTHIWHTHDGRVVIVAGSFVLFSALVDSMGVRHGRFQQPSQHTGHHPSNVHYVTATASNVVACRNSAIACRTVR